jgi:imidazolonepropionase-like amidohydrolase
VVEYLPEELRAAVRAAADWGTYVAAHVYNPEGIRRALDAGVASIEHGHLIDEEAMRLLVGKGAFLSTQVVPFTFERKGPDAAARPDRRRPVIEGMDAMMRLAKKHGAKVVFGTDLAFSMERVAFQTKEFGLRRRWFTPPEVLRQATSVAAELLARSGRRNPYPGRLGVIEPSAYADLLLVDGNPLEDLGVLEDPERNLRLIMKDGMIYKKAL